MPTPSFDTDKAHHWFAVECNNAAWELVEQAQLSDADKRQMMHLAHASTYHWLNAGEPINELRAMMLLMFACGRAGDDGSRYAARAEQLMTELDASLSNWDRACGTGALAITHGSADLRREADALAAKLPDEDRKVYDLEMSFFPA